MKVQHQKFLKEYLKHGNASEAARMAGYQTRADQAGYQVLRSNGIRKALNKHMAKAEMDQQWLLNEAKELLAMAKKERRVGEGTGVLNLIAKVAGLLTEARKNPEDPRDKTDAELRDAVKEELAKLPGVSGPPNGKGKPDRVH